MIRTLRLTLPQLRIINAALAMYEAEDHEDSDGYRPDVMKRTRAAVWSALDGERIMIRLYDAIATRLACCGCIIGFAFLPVVAAGGITTWTVLT